MPDFDKDKIYESVYREITYAGDTTAEQIEFAKIMRGAVSNTLLILGWIGESATDGVGGSEEE